MLVEAEVQNLLVYCTTTRWTEVEGWFDDLDINLAFFPTRLELLSVKRKANQRDPNRL